MSKKVMMSVGGTGGHIYPAIALAQQLSLKDPSVKTLFIGGHLANNRFLNKMTFPFENISCDSVISKNPLKLLSSLSLNSKGVYQSIKAIQQFQPQVIIGFGSYHSFPTMVAAQLCRIPVILYAADSHPGKVIRLFSRFSIATAIQFAEAASLLKGNVQIVNMPLRQELRKGSFSLSAAKKYFQLDETLLTLLIFGGSQGAATINQRVMQTLMNKRAEWSDKIQLIHFTGREDSSAQLMELYNKNGFRACVKPFEDRMELAWEAADLVISRAGAASIAEQIEFEVPGILIPYPHATDNHQEKNGYFMKHQVGGAEVILEKEMNSMRLAECIDFFLKDKCKKINQMQSAILNFKNQRKALDLGDLILDTVLKG